MSKKRIDLKELSKVGKQKTPPKPPPKKSSGDAMFDKVIGKMLKQKPK